MKQQKEMNLKNFRIRPFNSISDDVEIEEDFIII